jgi:NhaP-type Na+/H+ or K+/H+ antiporter
MTHTMALLVAKARPTSTDSVENTILFVAATLVFVIITIFVSVATMTWYSKRHCANEHDGFP